LLRGKSGRKTREKPKQALPGGQRCVKREDPAGACRRPEARETAGLTAISNRIWNTERKKTQNAAAAALRCNKQAQTRRQERPRVSAGACPHPGMRRSALPAGIVRLLPNARHPGQFAEQLFRVHGLGRVAVHPGRKAAGDVLLIGVCRHRDNRNLPASAALHGPDRRGRLIPVHDRHVDIHQDRVEFPVAGGREQIHALLAVFRANDSDAPAAQNGAGDLCVDGIVLDQQNFLSGKIKGLPESRVNALRLDVFPS
jgi:hypothetical protein